MNRALVTLAVVLLAGVAIPFSTPFGLIALVPLFYATRAGSWRTAAGGTIAVVAAVASQSAIWGSDQPLAAYVATAALALTAGVFGLYSGARRRHDERERELLTGRAAAEERLRIARDLHDAVGHDVALMVVQAQALGAAHEEVREETDAIADLGRRTMAELHRTVRLLRDSGDDRPEGDHPLDDRPESDRSPGAGLADLDDLVDRARAAGVPLSITVDGAPRDLAPAVDQSAYRIVQEAVTNVVKHADRAPTTITLGYGAEALTLTVADAGGGVPAGTPGGHGLVGMRERAELFGGTLSAGPRDGGYEVRAVLPYEA